MGFNVELFIDQIRDDLICSICSDVLEDPVAISGCEHMFCELCISEWLGHSNKCPLDNHTLSSNDFEAVPRIVRNMLARLSVNCEFEPYGCTKTMKLEDYKKHAHSFIHDPQRPRTCKRGCGLSVTALTESEHDCIAEMSIILMKQQLIISEKTLTIKALKRERDLYRDFGNKYQANELDQLRELTHSIEAEEVNQWKDKMTTVADVVWSQVIGLPKKEELRLLRNALFDSGCPALCQAGLLENSDERQWPKCLCTNFRRASNRRDFAKYVCRKLNEFNAIVILSMENKHMDALEFEVIEPGFIAILKQEEQDLAEQT